MNKYSIIARICMLLMLSIIIASSLPSWAVPTTQTSLLYRGVTDLSTEQLEIIAFGRIFYTSRTFATFALAATGLVWLFLAIRKVRKQESDPDIIWGVVQALASVILLVVCSTFLYHNYSPMIKSWVAPQIYLETQTPETQKEGKSQ